MAITITMNGLFLGLFLLSISVCSFSPGYGLSGERMRTALMAGGFGSSTNKNKSTKKLRKVGGYTGAGTKPLRVAANTFDKIYKQFGSDSINDVYVRSLKNDETQFWFVGKIAWQLELGKDTEGSSIPTPHEAVISQKRLILEYAKSLRPQNLGGPFSNSLEVWIAPGDSELEVAQNKASLEKVSGTIDDISDTFCVADVGYNPEIYMGDEVIDGGLRVKRDNDGNPVKAAFDINQ